MALTDKNGRLVRFTIRPGNAAENRELPTLLDGVQCNELIADKAYDSNAIRESLATQNITATIPAQARGSRWFYYDLESYKTRHLVENFFVDLKQFRSIATRYCKLGESFAALINLAGWFIDSRRAVRFSSGRKKPQAVT